MTVALIPSASQLGPDPEPYGERFEFLLAQSRRQVQTRYPWPDARIRRPRIGVGRSRSPLLHEDVRVTA